MTLLEAIKNHTFLDQKRLAVMESQLLKEEQVSCPVIHRFAPGVYIREVTIPAGTFAIGHKQNYEHLNVFLKGRVTMFDDEGRVVERKAPMIFTGKPGRKIGFVHEDMVWLNVYATNEQDIEKLEKHYLTKTDGFLQSFTAKKQLSAIQHEVDRNDYLSLLSEINITEQVIRAQSENIDDLIDLPFGDYKIKTAQSGIEGAGLFATADIAEGELIAPARIDSKRTIVGKYTNHSANPNAKAVCSNGHDIDFVATRKILGCIGGFDGEEITVNYRQVLSVNLQNDKRELLCQA